MLLRPLFVGKCWLSCGLVVFILLFPLSLGRAADLTVTTTTDVVNGDVSSPQSLTANPGPDGISLREAVLAVNNAVGPHSITFAAILAGQTINITSPLFITRDGITLTGLSTPDGQPNITLDAVNFTTLPTFNAFLFVYASDFTMTRLRIIRVQNHALRIMAGQIMYPPPSPPPEVRNIRIEDNVFDNSSLKDYPLGDGDAIRIWMEPEGIAADASITNVQIVHNTFRHFQGKDAVTGTGVIIVPSGTNCVIRDVVIQGNTFVDTMYPVEVGISQGSNNRVVGTRIFENTFTNGLNPIFIGINVTQDRFASGSVIEDTVIRGNVFFGTLGSVEMVGGHTVGEATNATGNSIINTQIVNNLIVAGNGIHIIGGGPGGSGNRVDGVQVINNTIITYPLAGVHADKNRGNGTENSVTGVSVLNTIIQNREPDKPRPEDVIAGEITPDQVRFSIISTPRFVGVNGNISADPKFVNPNYANPGEGDFHLQPGSPAIDAGTSDGAPSTDLEGHARFDDPSTPNTGEGAIRYYDIGAFEYGSHPALYFPHVATNFPWQTEIAIINTSDQTVTGTLRGLSDEGQLIETKNVTLSARGRRQITIADEFTNHTNIGYIIFDTSSVEVQGYTKFYIAGSYRAAIPAVKEVNTSNIYIPHIASNADWWTGVSLVNTTSAPKVLTITFNNGQSRQITLTANQHRAFDIAQEFFNNQPRPDIQSAVITNASGIIGLELFGSKGWGTQLEGVLLTDKTTSTIYYPHVASNDYWWTGIVAYNPSVSACNITITPYSAEGTTLTPLTPPPIPGKGKYIDAVANLGLPARTAWFRIDSTSPITGFELFGTIDGNQLAAYAGMGGTGAKAGVFAKIEKNGWTGIAFINTEANSASVTLTAYNDNGTVVATQSLSVPAHAKVVNNPEWIFSQDISSATYIAYSSDRNVVGFQLNGSSDWMMLDGLPGLTGTN